MKIIHYLSKLFTSLLNQDARARGLADLAVTNALLAALEKAGRWEASLGVFARAGARDARTLNCAVRALVDFRECILACEHIQVTEKLCYKSEIQLAKHSKNGFVFRRDL